MCPTSRTSMWVHYNRIPNDYVHVRMYTYDEYFWQNVTYACIYVHIRTQKQCTPLPLLDSHINIIHELAPNIHCFYCGLCLLAIHGYVHTQYRVQEYQCIITKVSQYHDTSLLIEVLEYTWAFLWSIPESNITIYWETLMSLKFGEF